MATYSDADFEDSRFDYGERVRVQLRHPRGFVMGEVQGTCAGREKDRSFETPEGKTITKTLVWVKELEGYEKPHPNLPDTTQKVEEAWFAEEDLRKLQGDILDGLSTN